MNITIIGAGGVGGYFGGRLTQAGNQVTFVARGEHGNVMVKNGLKILSPKGDYLVENPNVVDSISKITNADLVLLGVKAWQVKEVALQLKNIISDNTVVIPLQNGVMAAKELLDVLPEKNVMGGLCSIFSKIKQPGVIEHMSATPTIVFGELDNVVSERSKQIQVLFNKAAINNKLSEYVQGDTWKKFMLICLGALGALTRASYGVLCKTPELRNMLEQMLEEMYMVSQKEGIKLNASIKGKTMQIMDAFSPEATSSMARDIWAGKPSELDYQVGTVVQLAKRHHLKVAVNHFIYYALLPQEQQARNSQ